MKKLGAVAALVTYSLVLAGCNEERHTVEWWLEHDEERAEFVKECRNDNANNLSANCQNALEAHVKKRLVGEKDELNSPSISG